MRVGLAIVSYNRCEITRRTIEAVRRHTKTPHELVVVDDGSPDGTHAMLEELNVAHLRGPNCGVVWNKNRALFYLHEIHHCDVVILLEEDTFPTRDGWERDWIEGALRWGHVNLAPAHWPLADRLGGTGTPEDPIHGSYVTGQCSAFSSEALSAIGFLDTRFRGYGFAHAEHTIRFLRAGYGGYVMADGNIPIYYLLRSSLEVTCLDKPPDANGIARNGSVFEQLKKEPLHRWCWRNDEEMAVFYTAFNTLRHCGHSVPSIATKGWFLKDSESEPLVWDIAQETVRALPNKDKSNPQIIVVPAGEEVRLGIVGAKTSWLKWSDEEAAWSTCTIEHASGFKIVYERSKGLGFLLNSSYLCTDRSNQGSTTPSRQNMKGWETFHFAGFTMAYNQLSHECGT